MTNHCRAYNDFMMFELAYLNTKAVDSYLAQIEDGLLLTREKHDGLKKKRGVNARVSVAGGEIGRELDSSDTKSYSDTPDARFSRLLRHIDDSDNLSVFLSEADFDGAQVGELISWYCGVYIPDAVKLLTSGDEINRLAGLATSMMPLGKTFGVDMSDMPPAADIELLGRFGDFAKHFGAKTLIVGEDNAGMDWKIAAQLNAEFVLTDELDGDFTVIGKAGRTIPRGESMSVLALPGTDLLPRDQRRNMAKKSPSETERANYVTTSMARLSC